MEDGGRAQKTSRNPAALPAYRLLIANHVQGIARCGTLHGKRMRSLSREQATRTKKLSL